jgi:cysteine synthase
MICQRTTPTIFRAAHLDAVQRIRRLPAEADRSWRHHPTPPTSLSNFHVAVAAAPLSRKCAIQFPTTIHGEQLPFNIPRNSWLNQGIGNTPLVNLGAGVHAKLEGHNPGGSIKDRTLCSIIFSMLRQGTLRAKGDTLCLVTSGSAGMSLSVIHEELRKVPGLDLNVVIVMPTAYSKKPIPAEICALDSTDVHTSPESLLANDSSRTQVLLLDGVFMDVLAQAKEMAKENGWQMLDQHYDANSMDGHKSTALELMQQLPEVTDVVCATGTGATAAGLLDHLPDHIKVHSRAAVSGTIDGLSDVQRYNNFCKVTELEDYNSCIFDKAVAESETKTLEDNFGIVAGPSSGATYWLAKQIKTEKPDAVIAFICADGRSEATF